MYARRTSSFFFSEQECDLVTVLVCINLTFLLRRSCRMHNYTWLYFIIVAHQNVDNRHNHWHDVFGRKQLIYKLYANIGNSCIYTIALAALMQLNKMLYSKSIVNRVTFKLKK